MFSTLSYFCEDFFLNFKSCGSFSLYSTFEVWLTDRQTPTSFSISSANDLNTIKYKASKNTFFRHIVYNMLPADLAGVSELNSQNEWKSDFELRRLKQKWRHETNEIVGSITWSPTAIKAEERNALQLIRTAGGSFLHSPMNMWHLTIRHCRVNAGRQGWRVRDMGRDLRREAVW